MASQGQELKEQMLKQAEQVVHKLLAEKRERRDLSLSEMENLVGEVERELSQMWMQALVEEAQQKPPPCCEVCGSELRYKGKKGRQVVSLRGEVAVERDYYYCPTCQQGSFPPR